ncbi:MAG: hypothetical protein ACLPKE_08780 [Streptosporangiaceae bacterium]
MFARFSQAQWGVIVMTAGALTLAGCSSSSRTPAAKATGSPSASPSATSLTATQAIARAGQNAGQVTSFAAAVNVHTAGGTTSTISGTLQERTEPSPLVVANFGSVTAQGQSLPGGIEEILDSNAIYLKLAQLGKETGKPWVEIPASELSQISGGSLGQLLQNNSSDPMVQTQMLASSTNVKKVGTATLGGVPVTEYTGTYPVSAGLAKLPASERTKVSQQFQALGLTTEQFKIWLDGKQQVRKVVTSAQDSKAQETSTIQVTSINGPVNAAIPAASQTATVPASELGGGGENGSPAAS